MSRARQIPLILASVSVPTSLRVLPSLRDGPDGFPREGGPRPLKLGLPSGRACTRARSLATFGQAPPTLFSPWGKAPPCLRVHPASELDEDNGSLTRWSAEAGDLEPKRRLIHSGAPQDRFTNSHKTLTPSASSSPPSSPFKHSVSTGSGHFGSGSSHLRLLRP